MRIDAAQGLPGAKTALTMHEPVKPANVEMRDMQEETKQPIKRPEPTVYEPIMPMKQQ